jgi:uncharacterized protein YdhG (YjbR/CyaY superfamily)
VKSRPPATIDEYLATVSDEHREALERLRRIIHAAVPRAEECISYQIPAFRLDGRVLVFFGAATKHCSFFPGAAPIAAHARDLARWSTSKGTVRFQPDKPLPATLVRKLVRTRLAERARVAKRSGGRRSPKPKAQSPEP